MDISSILNDLSEDDIKKLQETAAAFFGGNEKRNDAQASTSLGMPGFSPQMLGSVAKISSALSGHDPRSDFLYALKPLLSPERQKKADEAAMMMKLIGVLKTLKEGRE